MYLVDTSVWIHALRPAGDPTIRSLLKPLITTGEAAVTEWILLELMTGLRGTEHRDSLLQWFAPLTRLPFDSAWWEQTWDMAARLRKKGISPNAADCFIATIATNHRVPLVHCDGDFETMKPTVSLQTLDWTAHQRR